VINNVDEGLVAIGGVLFGVMFVYIEAMWLFAQKGI
jgi:hypothetical protein